MHLFDIETKPRAEEDLRAIMPEFEAPSNWKDPDKIRDNVNAQRRKWMADAALSPLRGEVLAIGWLHTSAPKPRNAVIWAVDYTHETEAALLRAWCDVVIKSGMGAHYRLGGWNLSQFDLPFIVRRLWANRIAVPQGLMPNGHSRFYWPSYFIDLRDIWAAGDGTYAEGNLATVGAFLGVGTYSSSGEQFASLWADPATRHEAVAHLTAQLSVCAGLAELFGQLDRP